jgi:hypothetical protein
MTIAGWEGEHSCMTTSMTDGRPASLIAAFDTLRFTDSEQGLVVDSPVATQPRPPELVGEVEDIAIVSVRPAINSELERVPRRQGHATAHGEVFRLRADSRALLMLGRGSVVRVQPRPDADEAAVSELVEDLDVEWRPRQSRRVTR